MGHTIHKSLAIVADDHEVARTLVAHVLQSVGIEVMAVPDGRAALEAAKTLHPSLMLLDVNMPGMDGFELLRRIKSDPDLADIPIIMLTASGMSRDIVEALEIGASDYMTKPFSPAELLARVRRVARDAERAVETGRSEKQRAAG